MKLASANSASSSDDDTESGDEQDNAKTVRKRDVAWCAVDTENHSYYQTTTSTISRRVVVWPPPSSSSTAPQNSLNLRPAHVGRPFGNKMQLFSKTGHHLAVYPDGTVKGTPDENDLHTYLEVQSADFPGHVKIKGLLANMYVGMDYKGRLYAEADSNSEATVFIETFQGSYNSYQSRKYAHLGWFLGIKKIWEIQKGSENYLRTKSGPILTETVQVPVTL
ncbi:hypothetical protein NQ317_001708, partial [Molorchus minor]